MGYVPCMCTIILASIQRQYGGGGGVIHIRHSTWRHGAQTILEGGTV